MAKATPFLMFQGDAQDAVDLYTSVLPDTKLVRAERYGNGEAGPPGTIKVGLLQICGREFMCADSPIKHDFSFTPASSIFVEFGTTAELDQVFRVLADQGTVLMPPGHYGFSTRFAWLNDRFGVSWQLNVAA